MDNTSTMKTATGTPTDKSSDHQTRVTHPTGVPVKLPDPDYYKSIPGWGIDADPENDPTYSMKPNRTDDEQRGYTWERPTQQPVNIEVLHSVERPNISSVFGEAEPPARLSGMIRRYAYQYSESSLARWLPLVLADRVDVLEGYFRDIANGHIPNVFAERGWGAEWRHDPPRVMRKVAIGSLVTAAVVVMACRKRNRG